MDVFPSAWFGNTKEHLGYTFAWFSYAFSFFSFLCVRLQYDGVKSTQILKKRTKHTNRYTHTHTQNRIFWQSPWSMKTTILKSCSISFYFFPRAFGWCEKSLAWINSITATANQQTTTLPTATTYWHTHTHPDTPTDTDTDTRMILFPFSCWYCGESFTPNNNVVASMGFLFIVDTEWILLSR